MGFKTELLSYKTREAYSDKISPLESHLLRGADAVKKHEFRRALTHFEQAQNLDMNNAYLWHRKISCLSRLHNYEEALEEIDKLLIKFPRYFKAMLRKGITLFWMARYRESLLQFYQVALNGLPHLKSAAALYARKSILCIFGEDSFIQYQPPDSIFHKLPYLLLLREIFPHFDARTLGRACKVCYLFRYLGETPILWRNLVYANFSKPDGQPSNWRTYYLAKLTQKANSLGYISISSSLLYQCVHCSTKFRSTDSRVCSSSLTHQHEISY